MLKQLRMAECHRFNLSAFQPSAYILNIGDLNAQCPTLAHCLCVCLCVSQCLGASLCSELQILVAADRQREKEREQVKERSLPTELFAHFSFHLLSGGEKEKGRGQKEDGRDETKTCSETEREER